MEMGLEIGSFLGGSQEILTECLRPPQAGWSEKLSRSSPTLKSSCSSMNRFSGKEEKHNGLSF